MRNLTSLIFRLFAILLILFMASCKKNVDEPDKQKEVNVINEKMAIAASSSCYEYLEPDWNDDTVRTTTILGRRLTGSPYSLAIMQQAAINLYGNASGMAVNKKYVRFKPSGYDQLQQLINLDLDLFDYPLDYEVLQEGNYYDQGLPANEIPWYYTVVDPQFTPPAGFAYEVLASLYVPDNDIYLENEAFRITGNPVEPLDCEGGALAPMENTQIERLSGGIIPNGVECLPGYHWDPIKKRCVADNCPEGYHWDPESFECVPDAPPPPPPAPPASKKPSGQILVRDNALNGGNGQDVAVRRTRVVIKRFLKIDRVYTDDQGRFSSGKHYHNKVSVIVKFKNNDVTLRPLVALGFFQMFFEIDQGIGKYSGNLSNITFVFTENTDRRSRAHRNWWAAQMMNAVQESNEMAAILGVGTLPSNLNVMLSKSDRSSGAGSALMNNHRTNEGTVPREWIDFFLQHPLNTAGADWINVIQAALMPTVDITLGYNTITQWRSDRVKALMYHEMAHARHFNKVGQVWWNSLVFSEVATIVRWQNTQFDPYGDGSDGTGSEYISVAESWAEHVARVMCDRQYGMNSTEVRGFIRNYFNNTPLIGFTSHMNYLEDYSPNETLNPFRWIPEGIYNDLIDINNETGAPIVDDVSGYTNLQIYNALDDDVTSMPQFRERLISENPLGQTAQARDLFTQYHY